MNEFDNKDNFRVEIQEERPIKTEHKHLASFRIYKGQQCYKMNISTGKVSLAKIDKVNADISGKVSNKVIVEKGFIYAAAINEENAERKLVQQLFKIFQLSTKKNFETKK